MDTFYQRYISKENEYYSGLMPWVPRDVILNPTVLNDAVNWLVEGRKRILDFGCGNGLLTILCVLRGADTAVGIDLAEEGIAYAKKCAEELPACVFLHGSIEKLSEFSDNSFDGVILSNILDNMRPEDAMTAFSQCVCLLKPEGKLFLKLNPLLSEKQIRDWNINPIYEDLLDDGMLLWNKDNAFWRGVLETHFRVVRMEDVYYEEYDKHERLFLCEK